MCSMYRKTSSVQERVKAGLRNARAKGKRLGRPRADVNETQIADLRHSGASWRAVAKELGIGLGTAHRLARVRSCGMLRSTGIRYRRLAELCGSMIYDYFLFPTIHPESWDSLTSGCRVRKMKRPESQASPE